MRGSSALGAPAPGIDGESLQTDVMRFMAIIAFCLIAILALVRNAEPEPVAAQAPPATPVPTPPAEVVAPSVPGAARRQDRIVRVAPPPKSEPAAVPAPAQAAAEPPPMAELPEVAPATPAATPAPEPESEQGLSLRFASDRDFMRLVAKGDIQVYAFSEGERVFGLARNFEFQPASAPGRLYELLPDTIPRVVRAALDRATRSAAEFAWGIRIPPRLEGQIREYVDTATVGELVIDRYGQVHHHAS